MNSFLKSYRVIFLSSCLAAGFASCSSSHQVQQVVDHEFSVWSAAPVVGLQELPGFEPKPSKVAVAEVAVDVQEIPLAEGEKAELPQYPSVASAAPVLGQMATTQPQLMVLRPYSVQPDPDPTKASNEGKVGPFLLFLSNLVLLVGLFLAIIGMVFGTTVGLALVLGFIGFFLFVIAAGVWAAGL